MGSCAAANKIASREPVDQQLGGLHGLDAAKGKNIISQGNYYFGGPEKCVRFLQQLSTLGTKRISPRDCKCVGFSLCKVL